MPVIDPMPSVRIDAEILCATFKIPWDKAIDLAIILLKSPLEAGCPQPRFKDYVRVERDRRIYRRRGTGWTVADLVIEERLDRSTIHKILKDQLCQRAQKKAA